MATSNVDVAARSCLECRANPISSFEEGTDEAEISKIQYPGFIKSLLTKYPWTFAKNKRALNQEQSAPLNGWTYSHIVPADTLMIWGVYNSAQRGAHPMTGGYEIFGTASGRRIYSDSPTIVIDQTFYCPESAWPDYFDQFAVKAFAHKICRPLTHNTQLTNDLYVEAYGSPSGNGKGGLYGDAMRIDAMQDSNKRITSDPLTEARFS